MDTIKKGKPSKEQQSLLNNQLENDLNLARNQFSAVDGRQNYVKKWNELSLTLNSIGGSNKNGEQWKKYWEDLRLRTKEKYMEIKRFKNQSGINGDGPSDLNEIEVE